ncbi:MAG: Gfo/Idh/MocA family oxidoreductase [Actinobacteria bacterium]|nr:Gfo/Idh/MocA family oxidoreductase [Actinomycetota bacterium]
MTARPLRWGILSTARIIEELLPGFAAAADAELGAVASRDGGRARSYAAANGIEVAHSSYEGLLDDPAIDCVYIPLPNSLHREWVEAALRAGKHVLCEKPLTATAAEAEALFDLAEERGLVLMEAFMYRHHPKVKVLRELVAGGEIGRPVVVRSRFHFTVADPATDIRFRSELAGGALRDVGCYCVSASNFLADAAPLEVAASARFAASGVDEATAATLRYESGLLAVFDCGMVSPLDVGVEVLGEGGRAILPMPWYAVREPHGIEVRFESGSRWVETPVEDPYRLEIENFCAAVRGDGLTEVSRQESVRNLETIERILATAKAAADRDAGSNR